ncbi:hypothetical protein GCM10009092_14260 [Bowmanella denitrificans]|uniref:Cyanophycinase n=1 Tax=Bowmanella denitrificans TaxID=366582 RepID=A0ABN0X066_9ALTE
MSISAKRFASLILLFALSNIEVHAANGSEKETKTQESIKLNAKQHQLMLVGGGLKTCSSLSQKNCLTARFDEQDKQQNLYQFSPNRLTALYAAPPFLQQSENYRQDFSRVIQHIYSRQQDKLLTRTQLRDAFDRTQFQHINGAIFYDEIPAILFDAMLDYLEVAQTDSHGQRKKERVDLANNSNQSALSIYQHFVAMAQSRSPSATHGKAKIAVITASSRDPFESADFYTSVFTQAGADVLWLPLDQSYQQARALEALGLPGCKQLSTVRAHNGSYNREAIYPERTQQQQHFCQHPELMLEQLSQVQGVFFNGGDQSRTLAALTLPNGADSPELTVIKQRLAANLMVVGGTSAGTAVQSGSVFSGRPVPMISSGTSETAFKRGAFAAAPPPESCASHSPCINGLMGGDLTYRALGGTGLFQLGILDTHFSERDREARLTLLAAQTSSRFGFGVDETTALLVGWQNNDLAMQVIGQGGVFIVDLAHSIYKLQGSKRQVVGMSHYLTHGDKVGYNDKTQSLDFTLAQPQPFEANEDGVWRNTVRQACGATEPLRWQQGDIAIVLMPSEDTHFNHAQQQSNLTCSYHSLPFGMEN